MDDSIERGEVTVTAVVRPSSSEAKSILEALPNVRVMVGDLRDPAFVDSCVAGQDIVMSCLGNLTSGIGYWNKPVRFSAGHVHLHKTNPQHPKTVKSEPEYLEICTKNIIAAMKKHGVKKANVISASGVGDSYRKTSWILRVMLKTTALAHLYPYLETMESLYDAESELDVCINRPTKLTFGPLTGKGKVVEDTFGYRVISRADVAKWMLDESLKDGVFQVKKPLLADS